jgi:dinuclear metal center YbgI/SA1388 family protein
MSKPRTARIQDLVGLIHSLFPPSLAEEWDNCGLQVGDPAASVTRVLVALDPNEAALAQAVASGAQLLLTHHPLLLRPLRSVTPGDEAGRVVLAAARQQVAILSAHTNLDRAAGGLNDWLAARLGIAGCQPLAAGDADLLKLVVFVPEGHEAAVAEALFAAGAGHIGGYDRCSFRSAGTGTFRPGPGSHPFLGRIGETEQAAELRLETILPRALVNKALDKLRRAHPYEEVACDLIPLANRRSDVGLGRIGRLAEPCSLENFAARVKSALDCKALRLAGGEPKSVTKVAVCGGSGASLTSEAARQGADVLVTGDVKYHEARLAESLGLALVDAGHFATERIVVPDLAALVGRIAAERGLAIEVREMGVETEPFRVV